MISRLFRHIEDCNEDRPWGRFLDAGTGWGSLEWALQLETETIIAVTGSETRRSKMLTSFGARLQSNHRIVCANWVDSKFLAGQTFDTILVDYLVGAIDRFAPYFQARLFERLKPHLSDRLYLVGLEPYPQPGDNPDGLLVNRLAELRDATILLSGDRPHREYPRWWVTEQLQKSGYRILSADTFPNLYNERFVVAELDVCRRHLQKLPRELRGAVDEYEKRLRDELLARVSREPISWGADYVIAAEL